MKRQIYHLALGSVLAAGLVFIGTPVFAQDTAPQQQGPPAGRRGQAMNPDQELARLTKRYDLSADQQNQIKPILQDQQKKMEALRQDSSVSREDRRTQMASIRSDSNQKVRAVLNEDQQKKFDADQQRMAQQQQRGGGGGGQEGGAPPPQQ